MCGVLSFLYSREGAASRSPEQRASQVPRSTSLRRRQPRLVYQLSILLKPLQAGEVHVQRKEAGVAGHAVHRPLIAPGVQDRSHKRLRGSTAPRTATALASGVSLVPGVATVSLITVASKLSVVRAPGCSNTYGAISLSEALFYYKCLQLSTNPV